DICLSLARSGFYNIMVVSGHADPGNAAAVVRGIENAKKKNNKVNGTYSAWFDKGIVEGGAAAYFNGIHPTYDLHAGESETGFGLMRYPELLDKAQIASLKPNYEGEFLFERIGAGAKDFIECGAPDAYFGDPAAATAENADKQYDVFSDYVVDEVRALLG
ncbi:MAG: creatininase family protein, partial [Coprococcus sp.]